LSKKRESKKERFGWFANLIGEGGDEKRRWKMKISRRVR
jgi:hypothetical protein